MIVYHLKDIDHINKNNIKNPCQQSMVVGGITPKGAGGNYVKLCRIQGTCRKHSLRGNV